MAYVPVPKDLSKITTKLAFNLTKRQLICFSGAAAVGLPAYLFSRGSIGNSAAMFLMIGLMLPFFFFAMYERDGLPLEKVPPMTEKEYFTRGCTALLDAVGGAIHHIGNIHKYARREDVPEKTMFIITTDGYENASRRYSAQRVKEMIQRQKEKYGWEFLFLGANIDAVETAGHLGIAPDRAVNYHCDSVGTRLNYEVVGQAVAAVRCSAPLDAHWKDAIEEDFRKRQKKGRR